MARVCERTWWGGGVVGWLRQDSLADKIVPSTDYLILYAHHGTTSPPHHLATKKKPATLRRRRHNREESGDLGRGRRPLGVAAIKGSLKGRGSSLSRALELGPPLHIQAQAPAALEVADHGLGQDGDRFGVRGPLQLLLSGDQLIEHVFEPEQIGLALAHGTATSLLLCPRWNDPVEGNRCAKGGDQI